MITNTCEYRKNLIGVLCIKVEKKKDLGRGRALSEVRPIICIAERKFDSKGKF